ncbi:hypothetical protein JCM16303_002708 [Sporobolomyces ruberrimus]
MAREKTKPKKETAPSTKPKTTKSASTSKSNTASSSSSKYKKPAPPTNSSDIEGVSDLSLPKKIPKAAATKGKGKASTSTSTSSKKDKPKAPAPSTSTSNKRKRKAILVLSSSDEDDDDDDDESDEEEEVPKKSKSKPTKKKLTKADTAPSKKKKAIEYHGSDSDSSDLVFESDGLAVPEVATKKKGDLDLFSLKLFLRTILLNRLWSLVIHISSLWQLKGASKASSSKRSRATTKKSKANSPPTPSSDHLSSSSLVSKPKKRTRIASPPPPPPSYEQVLQTWFSQFLDSNCQDALETETETDQLASDYAAKEEEVVGPDMKMSGSGIEKLFGQMPETVSMEGVEPFVLAWNVGAQPGTFGSFAYKDFEKTFKPLDIRTTASLASHLERLKSQLYSPPSTEPTHSSSPSVPKSTNETKDQKTLFKSFYEFLFPFMKEEGSRTLTKDTAIAVLELVLSEKFELGREFVEFAKEQGDKFKSVSQDVWNQLLEFLETVGDDLSGWSEMDAWPLTIDQFVEWKQSKPNAEHSQ